MTPKTFSIFIESEVRRKKITHMDAILEYCYQKEVEPDSVTNLIQKPLKDKIEAEEYVRTWMDFYPKMDVIFWTEE